MIRLFERGDLDRFRSIVADRFGLDFGDGKLDFVASVLQRRLEALGDLSPAAYLDRLSASPPSSETQALAAELTVTETYFLRGSEHYRALGDYILPERIRVRAGERRLRLLSAGCASGEEAYSLAIILREHLPDLGSWDIKILGLDVNPVMVSKARKGRYGAWALRETPPQIRDKYFRPEGNEFLLDDKIRSMVSFEERNLAAAGSDPLSVENSFDIVLCRNVLMYLVPSAAQLLIARITRSLVPAGYLFVGYAETLRGLSQQFQLQHTHDSFYYQKSVSSDERPSEVVAKLPSQQVSNSGGAWMEAIQRTCGRIETLAQSSSTRPEPSFPHANGAAQLAPTAPRAELGLALELLRRERFQEAIRVLDRLSPETAADADTQLLKAVMLANGGDLEGAESICRRLLGVDDLNASAHYLMALCREHDGDAASAMEHDRAAIYLDATFAMPHLHLGRLARRTLDLSTARHELQRAATLLQREDAPRILLFGGGFSREALLKLTRAEFLSSGGVL